ncbi:MAG: hypothetical protein Q8M15_02185 [Bacteroidota bacterium]|nr:hypothetical protein [Bacteroidota bacterium]
MVLIGFIAMLFCMLLYPVLKKASTVTSNRLKMQMFNRIIALSFIISITAIITGFIIENNKPTIYEKEKSKELMPFRNLNNDSGVINRQDIIFETKGNNSPAISSDNGDININYGTSETKGINNKSKK